MSYELDFNAVYNIFSKEIFVLYGGNVLIHTFEDEDEWISIQYGLDETSSNFLDIHYIYDTELQLSFYPTNEDEISYPNFDQYTVFKSSSLENIPKNLIVCGTDSDFIKFTKTLLHD